eukprot:3805655-Rhodomonas_salina.1
MALLPHLSLAQSIVQAQGPIHALRLHPPDRVPHKVCLVGLRLSLHSLNAWLDRLARDGAVELRIDQLAQVREFLDVEEIPLAGVAVHVEPGSVLHRFRIVGRAAQDMLEAVCPLLVLRLALPFLSHKLQRGERGRLCDSQQPDV